MNDGEWPESGRAGLGLRRENIKNTTRHLEHDRTCEGCLASMWTTPCPAANAPKGPNTIVDSGTRKGGAGAESRDADSADRSRVGRDGTYAGLDPTRRG
eukprot:7376406-Prymnesium_polylepis.2